MNKPSLFHLIYWLIIALSITGCDIFYSENVCESSPCESFQIHLNNNFDDDYVRVEIDGKPVFNKRITTDYVWSLAEIIELERPEGTHQIKVVVNENEEAERSFVLDDKLYIYVRYYHKLLPRLNIPQGVKIDFTNRPPMYD